MAITMYNTFKAYKISFSIGYKLLYVER